MVLSCERKEQSFSAQSHHAIEGNLLAIDGLGCHEQ